MELQDLPTDVEGVDIDRKHDEQNHVDFVLVWSEGDDVVVDGTSDVVSSSHHRLIFESNLRKEGLILEYDALGKNGLKCVMIVAPIDVLKRYAEILKLRLPMRKFRYTNQPCSVSPNATDVNPGMQSWAEKIEQPFTCDTSDGSRANELTAPFSRDKEYLFDVQRPDFFTPSVRSRIIEFILKRQRISEKMDDDFAFGIDRCLSDGIYLAAYPLHDGPISSEGTKRHALFKNWASCKNIFKYQPLDAVRDYYGVKIGLYFAWLGFYSYLLILPSIAGLITFAYGVAVLGTDIPSQEICDNSTDIYMCPACDTYCGYWPLSELCRYNYLLYLFDNPSTVVFAIFMSFWAALFVEFWKQYSSKITHRWDVTDFSQEREHPRPKYLAKLKHVRTKTVNFVTRASEPKVPFWTRKLPGFIMSTSTVLLMVILVLTTVFGVIMYRISMNVAINLFDDETLKINGSLFISATGATINLVCILIFNQFYEYVATWLTELEFNRTQTQFDDSLSLKIYLLQFVNYYSSIFYIAFVKGKFIGHPGDYDRILGYRQEECSPGGCFMEVSLQMAIIFVGKQFLMAIVEYQLPKFWKAVNTLKIKSSAKTVDNQNHPRWVQDYRKVDWGDQGLFYEYLEMVIQYGFITIFVTAFPLAPLFALLNNIFELRLDAKKLITHYRRPVAHRVKDIGVWLHVLDGLGHLAVLTNGLMIAFTSGFIPRLVYIYHYSPDGSLRGYVNFTLSVANLADVFGQESEEGPEKCYYHDFRYPPEAEDGKAYKVSNVYWHVLAARFAFVVLFQNVVTLSVMAIKWLVPSIHSDLNERIRREEYWTNELIIRTELLKAKGELNEDDFFCDGNVDERENREPIQGEVGQSRFRDSGLEKLLRRLTDTDE